MKKEQFDAIESELKQFRFTSLTYTSFEEIKDYELINEDHRTIIMYGYNKESQKYEYHWGCSHKEDLVEYLHKRNDDELITFVPKNWVDSIKSMGFDLYAIWKDYFAHDLEKYADYSKLNFISDHDCKEASEVTLSCIGQSRGFNGQSEDWMKLWIENKEPASPEYTSDCAVIAEINQEILGVICVAIYESGDKKTLWIREIAVKPEFQGKGIARKLMGQAYAYGLERGAKKAFLMADACNTNAINLYTSMGFVAGSDQGQIDMIR